MAVDRRSFLAKSLAAGAGLVTATSASAAEIPGAESWNSEPAIRKGDEKLLKIGGVFGLWSHMSSSWWRYFNPPEGFARATGMRITHVWCVDRECGKRLAERYDAELVETYDGMVGKVDGMFIDDFFATPFMPELSLPYLNAGIPCFFDRPMASGMKGVRTVLDASSRTGTPFMASSAYEYLKEVEVAKLRLARIGKISAYEARNSAGNVYQYALHGLWFTLKVMGVDVERITHRTDDPTNAPGVTLLEHGTKDSRFYGTIHHSRLRDIMCSVKAYGSDGVMESTCTVDGRVWNRDVFTYLEMMHAFERMVLTKTAPESLEYVEAKCRIYLSMLYSVFAKNGATVDVAALPEDWDVGFPEGFSRSYGDDVINAYRRVLGK